MDEHAYAGHKEQPDRRQRIEKEAGVRIERCERTIALRKVQMPVTAAEPGVDNFLEGTSGTMREMRVVNHREASEQKRKHHRANADRADGGRPQSPPEEKHYRGPEGREERDEPDVI